MRERLRAPFNAAACAFAGAFVAPHLAARLAEDGFAQPAVAVAGLIAVSVIPVAAVIDHFHDSRRRRFYTDWAASLAGEARKIADREEWTERRNKRLDELVANLSDKAADLSKREGAIEEHARAVAAADLAHHDAAAELDRRRREFDLIEALTDAVQAQADIERQRIELRDERAALTGERIALDTARTIHATQVREASARNHKAVIAPRSRKAKAAS
jgi:hypothetical protein